MIQYISYADLNEFYSIKEVCRLLEMDKENLRKSCEKYNVKPSRNEIGDWGLTTLLGVARLLKPIYGLSIVFIYPMTIQIAPTFYKNNYVSFSSHVNPSCISTTIKIFLIILPPMVSFIIPTY